MRLAAHVDEIEAVAAAIPAGPASAGHRADLPLAVQVLDGVVEGGDGNHVDPGHHAGFGGIAGGHEERREPFPARVQGHRQHAAHRAHAGVQRQLSHHERALEPAGFDQPGRAEDADRGRQVEGGAFLAEIGGGEVDGDALDRELEARVVDGGAHPVAALANGRVGEADRAEGRQARCDVHLDEDGGGLDAAERGGADPGEHGLSVGTPRAPVNVPEGIPPRVSAGNRSEGSPAQSAAWLRGACVRSRRPGLGRAR
jgi:hypothetical protein